MTGCPVCSADDGFQFVYRENVPVTQNLIVRSRTDARAITRGILDMRCCGRCGFAYNRAFDAALVGYGRDYDNTQSHSPSFDTYLDELARHLVDERGVRGASIVEVGCGKGTFLRRLVDNDHGNRGWGYDPSYVGDESILDGRVMFRRELYGDGPAEARADVVVCRHVIEHVSDPVALVRSVRGTLGTTSNARVYFETPALEWILKNRVIWDFFYEHCSVFSEAALRAAFRGNRFVVDTVDHVFGGQYLWLEGTVAESSGPAELDAGEIPALARQFQAEERAWVERWRAEIAAAREPVAIWGAGAKGVTFANLVDPEGVLFDCVVDLNPHKQGGFVPGTGHEIVAPSALAARGVTKAILMNPNYRAENRALLDHLGISIELEG